MERLSYSLSCAFHTEFCVGPHVIALAVVDTIA